MELAARVKPEFSDNTTPLEEFIHADEIILFFESDKVLVFKGLYFGCSRFLLPSGNIPLYWHIALSVI
jgi:hypothetical protein